MVWAISRSAFTKPPPKIIKYRSYQGYNQERFCQELSQLSIQSENYKSDDPYNKYSGIFQDILDKHAPESV